MVRWHSMKQWTAPISIPSLRLWIAMQAMNNITLLRRSGRQSLFTLVTVIRTKSQRWVVSNKRTIRQKISNPRLRYVYSTSVPQGLGKRYLYCVIVSPTYMHCYLLAEQLLSNNVCHKYLKAKQISRGKKKKKDVKKTLETRPYRNIT